MPNLPKEELDKVFREGANQYDFSFKPEAWEHMGSLLDRDRRRRKVIWWWLGLLGLLVLGLAFHLSRAEGQASLSVEKETVSSPYNLSLTEQNQETTSQNRDSQNQELSITDKKISGSEVNDEKAIARKRKASSTLEFKHNTLARIEKDEIEEKQPLSSFIQLNEQESLAKSEESVKTKRIDLYLRNEQESRSAKGQVVELLPGLSHYLSIKPEVLSFSVIPLSELEAKQSKIKRNKLIFGVTFATEVVSIGFDDFSRLGFKAGVFAEYLFAQRLGLSSGANFIRKNYLAGKGEYHPPYYGFWTRKIAPTNTDGSCSILAIPLMLSYYAKGYHSPGLFVSAGTSSFFMLRERYEFIYDVPDTDLIPEWSTNEFREHWFGFLNFSIGRSGRLSNKLGYCLAFFGQTPLKEVGSGRVKLHSLGLNFMVTFQSK